MILNVVLYIAYTSVSAVGAAKVQVDASRSLTFGATAPSPIDRYQFFNVHSSPGSANWNETTSADFSGRLRASLGRSFVFSSRMSVCKEDPAHPGFVDKQSLVDSCQQNPLSLGNWPIDSVDLIHSSKTGQLYANGCEQPPKGFVPGSIEAAADFFSLFYYHCMMPSARSRYFIEVANECNVKVSRCNTTWEQMIDVHTAVAKALHDIERRVEVADQVPAIRGVASYPLHGSKSDLSTVAGSLPAPMVCGPTAAYPEFQGNNFSIWNSSMGAFIAEAGSTMDCLSVHLYSTFNATALGSNQTSHRTGSNAAAVLGLMASASVASEPGRKEPLPIVVSEYGAGFYSGSSGTQAYKPENDWVIMREVNGMLMTFLDRPALVAKSVPFIVARASWDPDEKQDPLHSYPWVLWHWHKVGGSNIGSESSADGYWVPTYLHLHYELWSEVDGVPVFASSSDANVQVQGFVRRAARRPAGMSREGQGMTSPVSPALFVAMHNLLPNATSVEVQWAGLSAAAANVSLKSLSYSESEQTPVLAMQELQALPATMHLEPFETVIVKASIESSGPAGKIAGPATSGRIDARKGAAVLAQPQVLQVRDTYSPQIMRPLSPSSGADFVFSANCSALHRAELRLGLGGQDAERFESGASTVWAQVTVDGGQPIQLAVDPAVDMGGQLHVGKHDGSFFGEASLEIAAGGWRGSGTTAPDASGVSGGIAVQVYGSSGLTLACASVRTWCSSYY